MSDEGPHAEQLEQASERQRTYVNDVETTLCSRRRIAMTIDEPQWRLADLAEFVSFAQHCGANGEDYVFIGTFHAEVCDRRPQDQVTHTAPPGPEYTGV